MPGDEEDPEQTNLWRETSFAVHLLRCAVNPILSLKKCLERWHLIAKQLAERKRKRTRQVFAAYQYQQGLAVPVG